MSFDPNGYTVFASLFNFLYMFLDSNYVLKICQSTGMIDDEKNNFILFDMGILRMEGYLFYLVSSVLYISGRICIKLSCQVTFNLKTFFSLCLINFFWEAPVYHVICQTSGLLLFLCRFETTILTQLSLSPGIPEQYFDSSLWCSFIPCAYCFFLIITTTITPLGWFATRAKFL